MHEVYQPVIDDGRGLFRKTFALKAPRADRCAAQAHHAFGIRPSGSFALLGSRRR
jgi:hypothetical protein